MKKFQFIIILFATTAFAAVQTPILKWEFGGNEGTWCQTAWYSSPTIIDIDGDGTNEVLRAAYSLYMLNGTDGSQRWEAELQGTRVWPRVEIKDINNDGNLEIISAHNSGYLNVMDSDGNVLWTKQPTTRELRSLIVADFNFDGQMEIVVGAGVGSKVNIWLYNSDGSLQPGWPQQDDSNSDAYAYGIFNDNLAVGNLDNDDELELVAPCDNHYVSAYNLDGTQVAVNQIYNAGCGETWGTVGFWIDHEDDLRGWAPDGNHRVNFDSGTAVVTDLDNDGSLEVIISGRTYVAGKSFPPSLYNGIFIFNGDRSRFSNSYDWTSVPINTGAPLSESYSTIESCVPNTVVVDIDGDGEKEILYPSYDGKMHCFWLDKTEKHNWPYSVKKPAESFIRFASEPVVADLDNDGRAEIIFVSWVQKNQTDKTGQLHILDFQGNPLQEIYLPIKSGTWNGALAAPALGDIDGDPDLEVVVNTVKSGACAYDLPGTENAKILWKAGRIGKVSSGVSAGGVLKILTKFLADARVGENYNAQIITTGGEPPYTFVINSGTLPNGLTMNSEGKISGIPTIFGDSDFSVIATDSTSASATQNISVSVLAPSIDATISKVVFGLNWKKNNKDKFLVKGSFLIDASPIINPMNISASLGGATAVSSSEAKVKKDKSALAKSGKIGKVKLVWNKKKKEVKFLVKLKKSNLSSALEIDENTESGSITPDFEIDFNDTNVKATPTINYTKKGTKTKGKL